MHVDEYFSKSTGLANVIEFVVSQEKTTIHHQSHALPDTLVAKVAQLLNSSRLELQIQGERWLVNRLVYGADDRVLQPFVSGRAAMMETIMAFKTAARPKLCLSKHDNLYAYTNLLYSLSKATALNIQRYEPRRGH